MSDNREIEKKLTAPDTITTWNAEAFCTNSEVGLGVAKPSELLVSQDFFVQLRLPYSVKRGEQFLLNVTVFNRIDADLPIQVTIQNQAGELSVFKRVHELCVGAKDYKVVSTPSEALKLGNCKPVTQGEGFKDALVKPLRVKVEGV